MMTIQEFLQKVEEYKPTVIYEDLTNQDHMNIIFRAAGELSEGLITSTGLPNKNYLNFHIIELAYRLAQWAIFLETEDN